MPPVRCTLGLGGRILPSPSQSVEAEGNTELLLGHHLRWKETGLREESSAGNLYIWQNEYIYVITYKKKNIWRKSQTTVQ